MATLNPEQLARSLERGLAPVYLVSGDEPLLVQESCDLIRSAAREQGFGERELHHINNQFDWNGLLLSAASLSLFAERKIIELRLDKGKLDEAGNKALTEYCQQPPEDNLLLMVAPKLDKATQRSKWYKALAECGQHIQIWPITPAQLPRWLERRLRQANLSANQDSIDLLAARTEGNLLAAAQDIEKLRLLAIDGVVTPELVSGSVADNARYDVFTLVDRCLIGDATAAVRTLHGLKGEAIDATVVLWALAREIRTLAQVADGLEQGLGFDRLASNLRIWDKRKPLLQKAVRRLGASRLKRLLKKANRIDSSIKGLGGSDPWDQLLELALNLSGTFALNEASEKLLLAADR